MTAKSKTKHGARLDEDIARGIQEAWKLDNDVPDERIRVQVRDGLATLEGNVETNLQKAAAEDDARRVKGVLDVVSRIGVEPTILGTAAR